MAAKKRILTQEEQAFVDALVPILPPVIARKALGKYLGGMVSRQTLANADAAGIGPDKAWRVGQSVVYSTDSLLTWIVARYGLVSLKGINQSLGQKGAANDRPRRA